MTTFKAGLKLEDFMVAPAKSPLGLMAEMLLKAQKYMNAENALATIGHKGSQRKNTRDEKKQEKGKKLPFVQ